MSLFLAVLYLFVGRGFAGNAFLDNYNVHNHMPVVYRRTSSHRVILFFTHNCNWLIA